MCVHCCTMEREQQPLLKFAPQVGQMPDALKR
jgi:hypothetical protein